MHVNSEEFSVEKLEGALIDASVTAFESQASEFKKCIDWRAKEYSSKLGSSLTVTFIEQVCESQSIKVNINSLQ
jgi:hypothetical protein